MGEISYNFKVSNKGNEDPNQSKYQFEHLVLREPILLMVEIGNLSDTLTKVKYLEQHLKAHFTIRKARSSKSE